MHPADMQRNLIIIGVIAVLTLGGFFLMHSSPKENNTPSHSVVASSTEVIATTTAIFATSTIATDGQCLAEGEVAEYPLSETGSRLLGYPKNLPLVISVKDKVSSTTKNHFQINDVYLIAYPIQMRACGIYVIRTFDYDQKNGKRGPNYHTDFWKYDYGGEGKFLTTLDEKKNNIFTSYFDYDFRISPKETYTALIRAFPGQPNFALIVKNLETMKDDMVFPMTDLYKDHPELLNSLALNGWSSDGRYFWANTFDAAIIVSFIRIDTQTGKAQIFPAPPDVLGGDAFNPDTGMITQHPGNFWSGDADYDAEVRKEREAQGEGTDLYVHNLLTGKRTLVAHSPYATQYFRPKWLSTSTLEYFMPTVEGDKGERRMWVVQ